MLVLAFDTATPAVTVAVCDNARVIAEAFTIDPRRHGELLVPAIEATMSEAGIDRRDLEAIAVGVGPGPFTSLRVGLVTATTLGAVLTIPVYGVCTLDAIALDADRQDEFLVITDALRREIHWARYAGTERVDGPAVEAPAALDWSGPVIGYGAAKYPDQFPDRHQPEHVRASAIARYVTSGRPTLTPAPLYLRRPDATPSAGPKPVLR